MVLCRPSFGPIRQTFRGSLVAASPSLLIIEMADRRGRRNTFGRQLHGCHRRSRAASRRVTAASRGAVIHVFARPSDFAGPAGWYQKSVQFTSCHKNDGQRSRRLLNAEHRAVRCPYDDDPLDHRWRDPNP